MKMVYAGGMVNQGDIHHDVNSHLASIKADLFLLEREMGKVSPAVKSRLQHLDEHVTELHQLLKIVLHDIAKPSD